MVCFGLIRIIMGQAWTNRFPLCLLYLGVSANGVCFQLQPFKNEEDDRRLLLGLHYFPTNLFVAVCEPENNHAQKANHWRGMNNRSQWMHHFSFRETRTEVSLTVLPQNLGDLGYTQLGGIINPNLNLLLISIHLYLYLLIHIFLICINILSIYLCVYINKYVRTYIISMFVYIYIYIS